MVVDGICKRGIACNVKKSNRLLPCFSYVSYADFLTCNFTCSHARYEAFLVVWTNDKIYFEIDLIIDFINLNYP